MVVVSIEGVELRFETLPDLFSPKKLDNGTRLLLQSFTRHPEFISGSQNVKYEIPEQARNDENVRILDWGCGWGAIGIYLAKNQPSSSVIAIDSDIAATKITTANAKLNTIDNLSVLLSHGFDEVDKNLKFNLIVSNPPTHRGREVVEDMIAQSFYRLQEDGVILIVVEARLKPWVSKQLNKVFGDYKIVSRSNKHVVLMATKIPQ